MDDVIVEGEPSGGSGLYEVSIHCVKNSPGNETPNGWYECYICGYGTMLKGDLRVHMKVHRAEKPGQIDSNASSHVKILAGSEMGRRMSSRERTFSCNVCNAIFRRSDHLTDHMRLHTRERPYTCISCGLAFRRSQTLKEHVKKHTGERPYPCDICGSNFTRMDRLIRHKRIHTGEKPYECEVCGSRFARQDKLKVHRRTHTGEKPYVCDVCGSRFTQSGSLKAHRMIHVY